MKFSEKEIKIFKSISMATGIFTIIIAITMIFSLIQLKTIKPLDSPSLLLVKEQFDKDPGNRDKAEQVRAMDLMSRKAYFSSRWQVETGSYLLLAGAFIYVLLQRIIAGTVKPPRSFQPEKPDINSEQMRGRKYLMVSAVSVIIIAVISSFILRDDLPAPGRTSALKDSPEKINISAEIIQPEEVNYPFFRGKGSRGVGGGSGYITEWNGEQGKNIKWKIANPKPGQSSPVIWGDKLFITGAGEGECAVFCIDKNSGELLWTGLASGFPGASTEEPESDIDAGMAVPTPAVDNDHVCAIFGNGNLVCFDHDGNLEWGKNAGVPMSTYGYSSSLLIFGDNLLVQYDSQEKLAITAFSLEDGELKWETPRQGRPVNSSPVLAIFDGQPQILINGNPNVSSFDPVKGNELWSLPGVSGDVAASLAVNSTTVFAAADYYKVIALNPGMNGSAVWEDNTFTPDVSSPVANDKYLFVTTGNGDAACYNAATGDTLWTHYFEEPFYSSPIICDNKVWMLDRSGTMHIVEADSKLKIIASSPLGEQSDCTPVFSEKKIYIRGKENLYCISEN